jgi:hypothetical protein
MAKKSQCSTGNKAKNLPKIESLLLVVMRDFAACDAGGALKLEPCFPDRVLTFQDFDMMCFSQTNMKFPNGKINCGVYSTINPTLL